jgi:3-oxoacyl-[acyl-carrier protein] reductase
VRTVDVTDVAKSKPLWLRPIASAPSGAIDILVNNAGGVLGEVGQPIENVTITQWNDIIAVNMSAAFYFAQAVAPGMKLARTGRIINISSGACAVSLTDIQAYATAKARKSI